MLYTEVKEFIEKISDVLDLTENERNEIEHILFAAWNDGYQKGLDDGCRNE
jgi:hypothetical protein